MKTHEESVNPEDFSPEEHAAVDAMAAPMIEHFKGERKLKNRFNSRDRKAWNRMNRPEKCKKIDKGATLINALVDKGIHLSTPKEPRVTEVKNGIAQGNPTREALTTEGTPGILGVTADASVEFTGI